jgi:AcrR family transcriptional regulator
MKFKALMLKNHLYSTTYGKIKRLINFLMTVKLNQFRVINMSSFSHSKTDSKFCILGVATRLFAKLGLDKCSTREIAKQSDINVSLISYYFGGKEGLYKEVLRNHALKIKEGVQKTVDNFEFTSLTREQFIDDMSQVVDHLIQSQLHNPEMTKIIAREKLAGFPHAKEIHSEIFYPLIQKFYRLFEAGQRAGFVKKEVSPALFFLILSESICGVFNMMEVDLPLTRDCEKFFKDPAILRQQIISIFLTGVLQ